MSYNGEELHIDRSNNMLWFPPNISRATYMAADTPHGEKLWVGAEDTSGRLITAWSQCPESSKILAQLKFNGLIGFLDKKALERENEGYRQLAVWEKNSSAWADALQPSSKTPFLHTLIPYTTRNETHIGSIRLASRVSASIATVLLGLYKVSRADDILVRLDHCEYNQLSVGNYPLWQTVYANEHDALEAVEVVILNRQKIGYAVEHKDVSQISSINREFAPTPLNLPGPSTIIWDF